MHYPIIIILGISNRGNPRAKTTTQTGLMGIFVTVSSLMHDDTIGALTSIRLPLWGWMVFARKKKGLVHTLIQDAKVKPPTQFNVQIDRKFYETI